VNPADQKKERAVFLDRDGVLNKAVERDGKPVAPLHLSEFQIIPGAAEAVQAMRQKLGARIIVVTNQPDVERGTLAPEELERMHRFLKEQVKPDEIVFCPHGQDGCRCRKPEPGMLLGAAQRWQIDLARSFMIGDSWKDMQAGTRAGCRTILLRYPYNNQVQADYTIENLQEAVSLMAHLWEKRHENIR